MQKQYVGQAFLAKVLTGGVNDDTSYKMYNDMNHILKMFRDTANVPTQIDSFLSQSTHGSLFQSPEWINHFERNSKNNLVLCYLVNKKPVFAALVQKRSISGTKYFYGRIRRGPVFEDMEYALNLWDDFENVLLREGCIALCVYPYWERFGSMTLTNYLSKREYVVDNDISDHSESITIDLTRSEDEIFSNFSKSRRNGIRRGYKQGIKVNHVANVGQMRSFWEMYNSLCKVKGIRSAPLKVFEKFHSFALEKPNYCACIVALLENEIIGGEIVLRHGDRVVMTYGGGTPKPLKGITKNGITLWHALLWAKETGASIFDLGGITSNAGINNPAWGINHFKRAFTDKEIMLFTPMRKVLHPVLFKIFKGLRKTKHLLDGK